MVPGSPCWLVLEVMGFVSVEQLPIAMPLLACLDMALSTRATFVLLLLSPFIVRAEGGGPEAMAAEDSSLSLYLSVKIGLYAVRCWVIH
ncbi:hypothetical protein GH714_018166 [Hevea brasiliensis]|uniref:Uncharacterized protein n=1 Tax=Hevea brasiliensis TaxID=3981 RepID=A0A6A6MEG5_HEVBR|nr:hypothetical protein GH714_018166 [Hevea brasiliensis]